MKYVCSVCGWEYDESAGYPEGGIAPVRPGARCRRILSAPCAAWVRIPSKRRELSAREAKTMSYENWKDKIGTFEVMDVRGKKMDFFPALKAKAAALKNGEGLHIIQTFEPHPLYAVMEGLGYEHHTEQRGEAEFHVWFCRVEKKEGDSSAPFKPLALLNYPMIDEKLGQIAVDFWETTWQSEKRVLPYETRLLLSLTNAVGAGRMRQAARELVKAYIHGVESAALDDVFELLAWNQGIGFFSSEIGPSALFQAYKLIKNGEKQGKSREDICSALREKFGEKNPEMQVLN